MGSLGNLKNLYELALAAKDGTNSPWAQWEASRASGPWSSSTEIVMGRCVRKVCKQTHLALSRASLRISLQACSFGLLFAFNFAHALVEDIFRV